MAKLELKDIPVAKVMPNPFQERERFDPKALKELAQSLRTVGLLQPIIVRARADGDFQIVSGERRWRAAQMAGFKTITAIVRPMDDETLRLFSLVENLQRADLSPQERENAIFRLWGQFYTPKGATATDLANDTGVRRSLVTKAIRSVGKRAGWTKREKRRV